MARVSGFFSAKLEYQNPKGMCPKINNIMYLFSTPYKINKDNLKNKGTVDYLSTVNMLNVKNYKQIIKQINKDGIQKEKQNKYAYYFEIKNIKNEYYKLIQDQKIKLNGTEYSYIMLYENFSFSSKSKNKNYLVLSIYNKQAYEDKKSKLIKSDFIFKERNYNKEY